IFTSQFSPIFTAMGIEKDIQQQHFRNEYQEASVDIIYSAYWLNEQVKTMLDPDDITPQQYNILRILRGSQQPLSTLQIRSRMLDKMSDTSRIVERLLKKGLVEKKVCTADKRLVDVSISKKGLSLLDKLDKKNAEIDQLMQNLSETEAATLNKLLDKVRELTS
ncbi:MAG: MarR family winged helix-turn-helix transcriptional regulator, partial [Sediminibacterium sp.]